MTQSCLRYYKERWTADNIHMKPLGGIPVSALAGVKEVQPINDMFRFELILKEDFLDLYLDPYYEVCFYKGKLCISFKKHADMLRF